MSDGEDTEGKPTVDCWIARIAGVRGVIGLASYVLSDSHAGDYTTAASCALELANEGLQMLHEEIDEKLTGAMSLKERRIIKAAAAFVKAIDTEAQIDAVFRQAPDEWCELVDAVICGRPRYLRRRNERIRTGPGQ